jgi:hypothetical protein
MKGRFNIVLSADADAALTALAVGSSRSAVVERLILAARGPGKQASLDAAGLCRFCEGVGCSSCEANDAAAVQANTAHAQKCADAARWLSHVMAMHAEHPTASSAEALTEALAEAQALASPAPNPSA